MKIRSSLHLASVLVAGVLISLWSRPQLTAAPNPLEAGQSHFATFGTNRVHYLTLGQGNRTVLFVHGWGGNVQFWREQVTALQAKAKLIFVDLPGHGRSDKPQVDYTMDFFADGVLAVMEDAKVQKAALVGHSMGTPVICRVYAKAPQRVSALVAVDGHLRRPKMAPGQTNQAEKFVAAFRAPDYRDQVKGFVGAMFTNLGTDSLRDWVVNEILQTPQHVLASAMGAMFNPDAPAWDLAKVAVPVLSINTKNPRWNPDYQQYVKSLSAKTDYRAIEGADHFLMLEKRAEFNAALLEMLDQFVPAAP